MNDDIDTDTHPGSRPRTYTQRELDDMQNRGVRPGGIGAPPPEYSINDTLDLRAKDLAISVLAQQIESMSTPPWQTTRCSLPESVKITNRLSLLAWALSNMMVAPIATGSNRATGGDGTLWYIDVSANKVWCKGEKACKALHARMMQDYTAALAAVSVRVLAGIREAASGTNPPNKDRTFTMAVCGQTRVYLEDPQAVTEFCTRMNKAYVDAVQPEIERTYQEILEALGPEQGATAAAGGGSG
jgi:hypothetical protein